MQKNRIYCSGKNNYGIWINHIGSIYQTGNNKTGEYSKKGRGARFITKDYKSREEGCMTKMLNELNLPTLQSRRQKQHLLL
jgi:hypothetical protein